MKKKDFYFKQAKLDNYKSRAAYKLKEILSKFSLLKKYNNIIELGSSPGGWTKVLSENFDNITAIDLKKMSFVSPKVKFYQMNFLDFTSDMKYDIIFSDIAPNTTGDVQRDHYSIVNLIYSILKFSESNLLYHLVVKTFAGSEDKLLFSDLKKSFQIVKTFKPKSSTKESKEYYIIALYKI